MNVPRSRPQLNQPDSKQDLLQADAQLRNNQAGLTLIECLVAIVMVALMGAIIAPAMVVSVATRVQSQRAAQALDIAQSEIDRVRILVERGEDYTNDLPPEITGVTFNNADDEKELASVLGPNSLASTAAARTAYTQAFPTDLDGDGNNDYGIQTFRTPGETIGGRPVAFVMGVRVYDLDAVNNAGGNNLPGNPQASLAMVDGEGERNERPLASLYSFIAVSEDGQSFCNYISYLSTTAATVPSTPTGCE